MAKKKTSRTHPPRRHTRFAPDAGAYARIDVSTRGTQFRPSLIALVSEEAYGGCGIVVLNTPDLARALKVGARVKIQVGNLDPMKAEIKWRADLDARVTRLGLMYIDKEQG